MARQVNAWVDDDEKLFRTKSEAEASDLVLNRTRKLRALIKQIHFSGITEDELVQDIFEHREEFLEALK